MRISFLTSGHYPFDDRIFYHMARSLSKQGNNVEIVSSKLHLNEVVNGIYINCFAGDKLTKRNKINHFSERLSVFKPAAIICSEPLTLMAARKYERRQSERIRIIYDITEWYPSGRYLIYFRIPGRWLVFIRLLLFNLWVSNYADSFIFGEWYKSIPYRIIYPLKSFRYISYYPDLEFISFKKPQLMEGKLRLSYSGEISLEKGYKNFFTVLKKLAEKNRDLKIEVKIIGWYEDLRDKEECEYFMNTKDPNINLNFLGKQSFENYLDLIKDTDIFIDLRSDNNENKHSLPIKLFYYSAFGKPVIFSDLKSIRKEVTIDLFGFLVKPGESDKIAGLIENYLQNKELYYNHCSNARYLSENYYNWEKIKPDFLTFITQS